MGALVSRTRKGAKAYVLRPFKRRGYFLTQEEYRERNPTIFDKIASGKYTEEAVEKMKLKRRDDFLALRRQTLAKVKDPGTRTAIMKNFFTSHKPPKRTRVNLPHKAWDVAGQTGAGVGSGRLGGVAGAGVPAGMSAQARVVSMDDAPVGALPDPRDIALGRAAGGGRGKNGVNGEASTAQSVHGSGSFIDRAFVERDESMHSGSEYDPVRYEQDIYSEYGASVYDDVDYFDGTTVYSGTTTPRAGVYSVHSGVGQMGSQKRRNDIARSHFGLGDPPSKPNDEVGEPLPVTLQRRMVEQDGMPVTYPRPTGLRRWDRYVEDEDRKIADCVEEERRRRAEHNREMRRIYKRKYGRWGKKHDPRPAPTWVDNPHEDAPWRRPRNKEGEVCSTREAVEGFDRELKMGTYGWWAAIELRKEAVVREHNAVRAAEAAWGENTGSQAWRESKPPAGGLSTAVPSGHAGHVPVKCGVEGSSVLRDGGRVTDGMVSAALWEDRTDNGRWRVIRAEHRDTLANARMERERIKAERAASRNSKRKAGV